MEQFNSACPHTALHEILQSRGMVDLPENIPLWKLKLSEAEYEALKKCLIDYKYALSLYCVEAALCYAEWWKRDYKGGIPSKEDVASGIGLMTTYSSDLFDSARRALKKYKYTFIVSKKGTYNLDMIISVGYRVNSHHGVQFRQWATRVLKEYMIKGFVLNDELLKNAGQGNYFDELLARIRDIRSSEKVFYRKVLEIYALSIDYDPRTSITQQFFKTVQNKMHFAAHGHTAAEIIFDRANANADFMGLTSWRGAMPTKNEAEIAKNYLKEEEVNMLNRIVTIYLDFAELQAERHVPMYMKDWITKLDEFLKLSGSELLTHAVTMSAEVAKLKADTEDDRFKERVQYQLSPVEIHILETFEAEQKKLKGK